MKSVHIISKILFYITRFLAFLYLAISGWSTISLSTGWSLLFKENQKYFQICYPFTQKPILLGDYNLTYIIFHFLAPIILYSLFFLLVSNVFKVFHQPKLFTINGIKHLRRFYVANLIVPGLFLILSSIFATIESPAEVLVAIHFILGIFAYFLTAIFKQGLHIQNEQDLII